MAKYVFLLLAVIMAFTSCDDTPKRVMPGGKAPIIAEKPYPKDKELPIDIPPAPAPYTGPKKFCFEMQLGENTSEMTHMQFILDDNDSIHGRLDNSYADRLPIHGNIKGVKEGTFLELGYTYIDSGVTKREQMILKWEDNKLYKKTGLMIEENGAMVLENPLNATLQLFLMKVNCK